MKPFLRTLVATLCLFAMAAGVLYYLGGKQIEYSAEIRISGSARQVMQYMTEPELLKMWVEDFKTFELDPSLGDGTGATGKHTIETDGRETQIDSRVLSFLENQSLTVQISSDLFDAISTWQLREEGDEVLVRQLMLASHKGIDRIKAPFSKPIVEEQFREDLEKLKSLVESGEKLPDGSLTEVD